MKRGNRSAWLVKEAPNVLEVIKRINLSDLTEDPDGATGERILILSWISLEARKVKAVTFDGQEFGYSGELGLPCKEESHVLGHFNGREITSDGNHALISCDCFKVAVTNIKTGKKFKPFHVRKSIGRL